MHSTCFVVHSSAGLWLFAIIGRDQTKAYRIEDRLGAAVHIKFRKDMADMGLDSVLADLKGACNFLVGLFPGRAGAAPQLPARSKLPGLRGSYLAQEISRSLVSELDLPSRCCFDHSTEFESLGILEEITNGTRLSLRRPTAEALLQAFRLIHLPVVTLGQQ